MAWLSLPLLSYAQSDITDSLKQAFNKTQDIELGLDLVSSMLPDKKDSARYYLNKIKPRILEKRHHVRFELFRGYTFSLFNQYDSAVDVYTYLLTELKTTDEYATQADINDRIGNIYIQLRENEQAETYMTEALNIRKSNNLTLELSRSYYSFGSLQLRLGKYKEATESFQNGIKNISKEEDKKGLLTNLYYMHGNNYKSIGNFDSARYFLERANDLYKKQGPVQMEVASSNELAAVLIRQNQADQAIPILEVNLTTIQPLSDWQSYNRTYGLLIEANEAIDDYKQALFYKKHQHDKMINYFLEERTKSVAKITEDFRTDKQLDQAEEEAFFATQKTKVFGLVIIIMIVVLIISYLLFTRAIQKKKLENLRAMVLGEENERKRVAKDLHDGIGVLLTSIKLRLSNFQDKVEEKDDFKNSLDQIDNACSEVRRISHNMIPASLTKLGLQEAILDLLDNVHASTDILIEEALDYEEGAYDESKEVLIYRVIQELVNNSLKYADPTKLSIELRKSKQDYLLTYSDNGKGFEKSKVKSGLGLRSIASRIDILKGKLTFESTPGQGTIFNIAIPYHG